MQIKQDYADGMEQATAALYAAFAREAQRSSRNLLLSALAAVLGVTLCFGAWFGLTQRSPRERELLHEAVRAERDAANSANSAKSLFLAGMSHELRTPLNAIVGYSEMLREGAVANARREDAADHDKVLAASRRLLGLIDELLDLSKAEAGKIVVRVEEFDPRALVEDAITTIEPAAAARGNRIRTELAANLAVVCNDEFRLGQCLANLLSNAAKFTERGEIVVRTQRECADSGEWLILSVKDTGVGMANERVDDLFQPFAQGGPEVAGAHGGTGLGLATTRQLARLIGGDIAVTSILGVGSTFTPRLPTALAAARELGPRLLAA